MKIILTILFLGSIQIVFAQLYAPGSVLSTSNPAANNVGVGTSTPNYRFTVAGGDVKAFSFDNNSGISIGAENAERPRIGFHVSDNNRRFKIEFNGVNQSTERLGIFTNNAGAWGDTEVFSVGKTGKVGIGTITPNHSLEITNNLGTPTLGLRGNLNSKIIFEPNDGSDRFTISADMDGSTWNDRLNFSAANASDILTLKGDGLVGIGTSNPQSKLHTTGAIMSSDPIYSGINVRLDGASIPVIRFSRDLDGSHQQYHNAYIGQFFNSGLQQYCLGIGTASSSNANYNTTAITVIHSGNVGIGTTSPDHKLTVDGGIKCEEVKVEIFLGTGPDYVFEKDYDLLSLSELETYITQNKHLPEVPSAKEMEANGLNLKEMNLLLLKKVEELTLHLIQKDKQIERLQNQNQNIEIRLQKIENQ